MVVGICVFLYYDGEFCCCNLDYNFVLEGWKSYVWVIWGYVRVCGELLVGVMIWVMFNVVFILFCIY